MIPATLSRLGTLRDRALRAEGMVVAEGRLLAGRLIAHAAYEPVAIVATKAAASAMEGRVPDGWPLYRAGEDELSAFAGFRFHRGVVAIATRPRGDDANSLLSHLGAGGWPQVLVLPRTRDPANLGALARSASAFGFGAVLLGPGCPDFLSRRALRASMGAVLDMPHMALASAGDFRFLGGKGYALAAAVLEDGATDLSDWEVPARCAIALGDEYAGLESDWLEMCDERVTIGMSRGPDSLNVAAAGAILMWTTARARNERRH